MIKYKCISSRLCPKVGRHLESPTGFHGSSRWHSASGGSVLGRFGPIRRVVASRSAYHGPNSRGRVSWPPVCSGACCEMPTPLRHPPILTGVTGTRNLRPYLMPPSKKRCTNYCPVQQLRSYVRLRIAASRRYHASHSSLNRLRSATGQISFTATEDMTSG